MSHVQNRRAETASHRRRVKVNSKRPIRYGLIGCGDMGKAHAQNYIQNQGMVETVAICDINHDNIRAMRKILPNRAKVRAVNEYSKVLEMDDVEAVIISTPNNTHCDIVLAALAAGKHVFCEKPMDVTPERCMRMIAAWEKTDRVFQIGLVYRYSPLFRKMAEIIAAGDIGTPLVAWCQEFRDPFPIGRTREWRYDQALSGGTLVEKSCHHFDLFNWLLGVNPVRVQALGGQLAIKKDGSGEIKPGVSGEPYSSSLVHRSGILDHALVNIEYENNAKANYSLCLFAPDHGLPFGVLGTRGRMATDSGLKKIELMIYDRKTAKHKRKTIDVKTAIYGMAQIGHSGGLAQHIEFCDCILTGKQAFCDPIIGIQSLYPAFAAQKSIDEGGRVVNISEVMPVKQKESRLKSLQ